LLGSFSLDSVDLDTGVSAPTEIKTGHLYTVAVGDRIVGTGSDRISLIRM
jgi:hypothetical protein